MLYIFANLDSLRGSLKANGKTAKNVKLFGKGFLHLVDHYFWYLPFASVKQGHSVRQKANVTEEDWDQRWQRIVAEHEEEGARDQLAAGWKAWLAERDAAGAGRPAPGAINALAAIDILDD